MAPRLRQWRGCMPRCCLARGLCLQPGGLPGGAAVPGALACTSHNCSRGEGGKDTRKKEHSGERARNRGRRGGDSKTWWPRVETSSQLLTQEAHSFLGWLFFPITVLPKSDNITLLFDCSRIPFQSCSRLLSTIFQNFFLK